MNNKGADQTVWMRRLVCAFVVRKQQSRVSRVEAHMILKPRLPGLRLAMCLVFSFFLRILPLNIIKMTCATSVNSYQIVAFCIAPGHFRTKSYHRMTKGLIKHLRHLINEHVMTTFLMTVDLADIAALG